MSKDTKTIITVLLLIFVFPVGFILMWVWTKWPAWVKIIISLPIIIAIVGIFAAVLLATINPRAQIQKAACVKQCEGNSQNTACINACLEQYKENRSLQPTLTPIQE